MMTDLVLIPALGCDDGLYAGLEPLLGPEIRCRTIVADAKSAEGCAAQVLAVAAERFVVLGTSFGGVIAAHVAVAVPDRVTGLVVIGAWPGAAADPAAGLRRSARLRGNEFEAVTTEMAAMVAHPAGPEGGATQRAFARMARQQGGELMARQSEALAHRPDIIPQLQELKCPALLLWGEFDRFTPAADGLRLSTLIPGSRYVELPDCGHFPSLEYPAETAGVLRHWLAEHRL